jgi:hypothetical protein
MTIYIYFKMAQVSQYRNLSNNSSESKYIDNIPKSTSLYNYILNNSDLFVIQDMSSLSSQDDYKYTNHEPEEELYYINKVKFNIYKNYSPAIGDISLTAQLNFHFTSHTSSAELYYINTVPFNIDTTPKSINTHLLPIPAPEP